jgi:hypothetical protein
MEMFQKEVSLVVIMFPTKPPQWMKLSILSHHQFRINWLCKVPIGRCIVSGLAKSNMIKVMVND